MSEGLTIAYMFDGPMASEEIENHLRHCFETVGCTRTSPYDELGEFRYNVPGGDTNRGRDVSLEQAIAALVEAGNGWVWCWYEHQRFGLSFNSTTQSPNVNPFSLSLHRESARTRTNDHPDELRQLIHEMYDALSPLYVRGDTYLEEQPVDLDAVKRGEVREMLWTTGFGPELVEKIGRPRLQDAPAWQVDECADGGIFLWSGPLPLSRSGRETRDALREHFGIPR